MNFRLVLLILLVMIFTSICVFIGFTAWGGDSLPDAYSKGNIEIVHNTPAGTVPHQVTIINKGKKPVSIQSGDVLISNTSQDLVVAEDTEITPTSNITVKTYCFQPEQKAIPNTKLTPSIPASNQIKMLIKNSDLSNIQNATQTQLQIWIIVSKDNINPNSGESSALREKQDISNLEFTENITSAKNNLLSTFSISLEQIKSINKTNTTYNSNQIINGINELIEWIKGIL